MSPRLSKRQADDYGFSCPSGGTWYACSSGSKFVGCCASNPCSLGCSQGNIRPGGFDPDAYGKFPDATCGLNSDFYTCIQGSRTFWGCCKSNPCSPNLCPSGDVTGAIIDLPAQQAVYLSGQTSSTTTSSTSTSTSTSSSETGSTASSTISSSIAPSTASPTKLGADDNNSSQHSKTNIAAIAGGAAGGGAGLAIIVGIIIYFICHSKRSRNRHKNTLERRQTDLASTSQEKQDMMASPLSEAPPLYSSPRADGSFPPNPHSHTYRHSGQPHYELPASTSPHGMWEPDHSHHAYRASELPVEGSQRMELESPMTSPHKHGTPKSPGGAAGDQSHWTAGNSPRQPTQALGITNLGPDRIEPSRYPHGY